MSFKDTKAKENAWTTVAEEVRKAILFMKTLHTCFCIISVEKALQARNV